MGGVRQFTTDLNDGLSQRQPVFQRLIPATAEAQYASQSRPFDPHRHEDI